MSFMQQVAVVAQIPISGANYTVVTQIVEACWGDGDLYLDVLDATLHFGHGLVDADALRELLTLGGSSWTVADDRRSLQRRVDETATANYLAATSPADEASVELAEAWQRVYGRDPDPSDGWDHAIKAVEAVLKPIVVPNQKNATLGNVVGMLKANPNAYTVALSTSHQSIGEVQTLEALLRMMWPNPDRHGGGSGRTPSPAEAEAVVQLAVTVVQWARAGIIRS